MPDGELVVGREVVLVLLSVTDSGSWIGESALCRVLLTRDLSFYVPMIRDMGMIGTFMTSSRGLETNNSC